MLEQIRNLPEWEKYLDYLRNTNSSENNQASGLIRSARYPVTAALHQDLNRPILYLTDKPSRANLAGDEIHFWLGEEEPEIFPAPDPLFYEQGSWDPAIRAARLKTLTILSEMATPGGSARTMPPLIVAPIRAVMTRTMDRRSFIKSLRTLHVNQEITQDVLVRQWVQIGYEPVETVVEIGKFSRRGGLLDIWPINLVSPIRIDFFGDEIDTIQYFDPATQRNTQKTERVQISPAREFLLTEPEKVAELEEEPDEFMIPVFHAQPTSLIDYLPANTLILMEDWTLIREIGEDIEEQAEKLRAQNISENILPEDFPTPYVSLSEIRDQLDSFQWHNLSRDENGSSLSIGAVFNPEERFGSNVTSFIDSLLEKSLNHEKIQVVSRQHQRLQTLWDKQAADLSLENSPEILAGTLTEGFYFTNQNHQKVHLFTDSEIFGWERPIPRKIQQVSAEVPEHYFSDLKPGDYVVHIDYGIGQYSGLVSRTIDGTLKEFLCVEYARGDQLFVPVHQADRLTNYIGPDGRTPELTRLGTQDWITVKKHVSEKVVEVAEDLLELYAKRQVAPGYAFSPDTAWQQDMEGSFAYIETEDQKTAIRQVKEDMERPRPMDRLICGDVGFGKTEVALRAAFKAACDSKQVAVLVPTTVLAQQHYETFKERFAAYPMNVEMLSRFRTAKEQDQIIKKLAEGDIDVIIGTHRLVSHDVKFKDLGLIIIDEEQRFGVAQKEYLKKMRTEVDVLTMTATPIPRTLYMALTGVRDISSINTPPDERVPIITHVGPYSDKLVRQAILRELERDGQVFFVHNRVQSIYAIASHLQKLVPEARFGIGHGQLPEKELSAVMDSFYDREIDVLVSTSIIESGLDVPNANTLIADRADTLGLAQLYQIRGRVGRSPQRAYAYFFTQRNSKPTEEGLERLEVIAENTQLGAGYSIAMRDLEIRGAGEILGNKQHGSIASVGFHLYTRLLAQAVRSVRQVKGMAISDKDIGITADMAMLFDPITVELPLNIGIPDDYVTNQKSRIRLYRRIASIHDENELSALHDEFEERFGKMPETLENLFFQMIVKVKAERIGLAAVVREGNGIVLRFPQLPEDMESRGLPEVGGGIRPGKNAYWLTLIDLESENWQQDLLTALELIEDRKNSIILAGSGG